METCGTNAIKPTQDTHYVCTSMQTPQEEEHKRQAEEQEQKRKEEENKRKLEEKEEVKKLEELKRPLEDDESAARKKSQEVG